MTKARENSDYTGLAADIVAGDTAARAGRKNLILNGSMQISQRGTTANLANGGSAYKTVDRFRIEEAGAYTGAFTITQDTDSPLGFGSSLKWDCTTADTALAAEDALMMTYKPEAKDLQLLNYGTSGALQATLSFWIKSNKTGTYVVWIYQQDGARQVQVPYTVDVADTWEHKTCVIPAHTTVAINNDTGAGLYIRWIFGTGTNYTSGTANTTWAADVTANRHVGQTVNLADSTANYLNITGVQLELGSVATDFEHRSYGEILADCQRYYLRVGTSGNDYNMNMTGSYAVNGGTFYNNVKFATTMRAAPTVSIFNITESRLGTPATTSTTIHGMRLDSTCDSTGLGYYRFNYTADAEL
jgi:hypothetical protein